MNDTHQQVEEEGSLLARWRKVQGQAEASQAPSPARTAQQASPLSLSQEVIWSFEQINGPSAVFNIPILLSLTLPLDIWAVEAALAEVVRRHEILRTRIERQQGKAVQIVQLETAVPLPLVDLMDLPQAERLPRAKDIARIDHLGPFDLESGPVLRARLLRLEAEHHILALTICHTAVDGWSMGIFLREWWSFYKALAEQRPCALSPPSLQYADYAIAQRAKVESGGLDRCLSYWREVLHGAQTAELPADHDRPLVRSFQGERQPFKIPPAITARIRAFAKAEALTPFMVLSGALQIMMARFSGQHDVTIGTHMANRHEAGAANAMGLFATMCPIRGNLSDNPSFSGTMIRAKEAIRGAFAHQAVPFEWVAAELGMTGDRSRNPMFQVAMNYQNARSFTLGEMVHEGLAGMHADAGISKFDLEIYLEEADGGLEGFIEYAVDLYERDTVERYGRYFNRILEQGLENPATPIFDLPILEPEELRRVIYDWNDTDQDLPRHCIHTQISVVAAERKQAPALIWDGGSLSYEALEDRSTQLALALRGLGADRDVVVGTFLLRTCMSVIAPLAILKAGSAFLPLEPAQPANRLAYMLEQAQAPLAIYDSREELERPPFAGHWIDIAAFETDSAAPARARLEPQDPSALAFVIFTSGSTGQPKGVMVEHSSLANNLAAMQAAHQLTFDDRMLLKTPVSFDVSIWELFWPLTAGAATVIAKPGGETDPAYLVQLMRNHNVSTVQFVPSTLKLYLDAVGSDGWAGVRQVISIGEALPAQTAEAFCAATKAELHNLYGPAEATLHVTTHHVQSKPLGRMPIGRPIRNCRLYVLDGGGRPAPIGVEGDLYIAGICVARGYVNAPELTAERFFDDPFAPGSRMYRTGDRGRWNRSGQLEYRGRNDHQVKIRGVRMELSEIETALRGTPEIEDAAVVVREQGAGPQLIGYLVATVALDTAAVKASLQKVLPSQMIPDVYVWVDHLPLSPNGKLDRKKLSETFVVMPKAAHADLDTNLERTIAMVWSELLGIDDIGANDNFFDLGGHSLLAVRASIRLTDELGKQVDAGALYETSSLRDLAKFIEHVPVGQGTFAG